MKIETRVEYFPQVSGEVVWTVKIVDRDAPSKLWINYSDTAASAVEAHEDAEAFIEMLQQSASNPIVNHASMDGSFNGKGAVNPSGANLSRGHTA